MPNFKGQTQRDKGEVGFFPLLKGITHDAGWWGKKKKTYQLRSVGDFPAGTQASGHEIDIYAMFNEKRLPVSKLARA